MGSIRSRSRTTQKRKKKQTTHRFLGGMLTFSMCKGMFLFLGVFAVIKFNFFEKKLVNLHATFDRALLLQTAHTTVLGPLMLLKAEHNVGRSIACYIRKHTNVTPVVAIIFLSGSWTVVLQNQLHKWCQDNKSYRQRSKADHMDTTRMTATATSRKRVVARSISVLQVGCVEV